MAVKERLVEFIKSKGLNNSEFCRSIGVSTAFVSSMVTSTQPDKIERITLKYPELNVGWLLTGEGPMLKDEEQSQSTTTFSSKIEVSSEAWDVIKKQAEALRIQSESNASKDRQMEELIGLLKKANARKEDNAECADASGSDLEK